jgi:hypothetical protein
VAWLVSNVVALAALVAILAGRRMVLRDLCPAPVHAQSEVPAEESFGG